MMFKVWGLIKLLYRSILRDLVVKAIDDPDSEVDDFILGLLDRIFEYDGKG
jgi:hypothetical protein